MDIVINIRTHAMAFGTDFKRLNEAWISTYFWLEESDKLTLDDPQKYILDKGGNVFIALHNGKPVGTCALMVIDGVTCELAKMAVDPEYQGQGIGFQLGLAFIEKARQRGFSRIVLEGNTKMEASIALYRKLGFHEVPLELNIRSSTAHKRCNIFMELLLNPSLYPEYFI
jgi:ribosomal protein S18 acetylase RimI-like enzyme